jgi:hypothetical protein
MSRRFCLRACRLAVGMLIVLGGRWSPGLTPIASTAAAPEASLDELWQAPLDLARQDLRDGPWGAARAPNPDAIFTFERPKSHGFNPGVVVHDPLGRVWHVKQHGRNDAGAEGPVEVVLSRVLTAIGYHQPPVYFLPSFKMTGGPNSGLHSEPGGRFRLDEASLHELGHWSWQQNPFVGTRPFNGLVVILLLFNSTDLKSSNNTLYEVTRDEHRERWYVVRDLGSALGETGRFSPRANDPAMFERSVFIAGVRNGFVEFASKAPRQELFRDRITTEDLEWAAQLLNGLSDRQWRDAFAAANYGPGDVDRFLRKIRANIAQALEIGAAR